MNNSKNESSSIVVNKFNRTKKLNKKGVVIYYPQLIHNRCAKIEGIKWQKVAKSGCVIQKNHIILDCQIKGRNYDGFYRRF